MTTVRSVNDALAELLKQEPGAFSFLKDGDLVEGTLMSAGARELLIDLGKHGTGVVYRGEIQNAREMVRNLKIGDEVHAKAVGVDEKTGYVILSLSEAGRQKAWIGVVELFEKGEPMKVRMTGCNKGGLTADFCGLQAFLPVSQLSQEHYPRVFGEDRQKIADALEKFVGEELMVKIIDANPRTGKLILSEKEAVEISSRELAKNYEIGQVIEGIISGVTDFGAFMRFADNLALEGLIRASELCYRTIENPKEVVAVDDAVQAKIIDIKEGKIALSLKVLKPDPWTNIDEKYSEGGEVKGTIYMFNPFGAIINLDKEIQGSIHVTEFGSVEEMKKQLTLGEQYTFVIESVNREERRIALRLITNNR